MIVVTSINNRIKCSNNICISSKKD